MIPFCRLKRRREARRIIPYRLNHGENHERESDESRQPSMNPMHHEHVLHRRGTWIRGDANTISGVFLCIQHQAPFRDVERETRENPLGGSDIALLFIAGNVRAFIGATEDAIERSNLYLLVVQGVGAGEVQMSPGEDEASSSSCRCCCCCRDVSESLSERHSRDLGRRW
jgi:hypothetical protein